MLPKLEALKFLTSVFYILLRFLSAAGLAAAPHWWWCWCRTRQQQQTLSSFACQLDRKQFTRLPANVFNMGTGNRRVWNVNETSKLLQRDTMPVPAPRSLTVGNAARTPSNWQTNTHWSHWQQCNNLAAVAKNKLCFLFDWSGRNFAAAGNKTERKQFPACQKKKKKYKQKVENVV